MAPIGPRVRSCTTLQDLSDGYESRVKPSGVLAGGAVYQSWKRGVVAGGSEVGFRDGAAIGCIWEGCIRPAESCNLGLTPGTR